MQDDDPREGPFAIGQDEGAMQRDLAVGEFYLALSCLLSSGGAS
jgi:hypothetical protein